MKENNLISWEYNSRMLKERFPEFYPCTECKRNGTCTEHGKCGKFMLFFRVAWNEINKMLTGGT